MSEINPSELSFDELRALFNPEGSSLRRAQLRMVEMLLFLDRVCKEHGISYWLDSGNLIGAARNGKYIPWDDDMDVCMLREDALKFKQVMLKENPSDEFVLQCRETDSGYFGSWIVLRDLKSEYIQESNLHQARKYRGLQVDIFIFESKFFSPAGKFSILWYRYLIHRPLERFKCHFWAKMVAWPSYFVLYRLLTPLFRLLAKESDYLFPTYGMAFKLRKKDEVFPLSEIAFEGHMIPAPVDTDAYLTRVYGNWKCLPETIRTHDVRIIFK